MKMIMIYDQVFQIVFANSNNLQHYIQHILQFCHKTDWVRVPILSDPRDASWKEMKEIMVTNDRAIWGKCPNFPKGLSFPRGHRWLPLKLWLLNLTKKNQFGTLAFSHNSNFKFWLVGERFMQTRGHKATDVGIQVTSEISKIFSSLLIWVKTYWIQPDSYNSYFIQESCFVSSLYMGKRKMIKRVKNASFPHKKKKNCQGSSGCDHQVATL